MESPSVAVTASPTHGTPVFVGLALYSRSRVSQRLKDQW